MGGEDHRPVVGTFVQFLDEYGTHCGKPYGRVVRPGDLINLYVSNVTYQGYTAQTARMIVVGEATDRQERVLEACVKGVKEAEKLVRPGVLVSEVNNAAFAPMIEAGLLDSPHARTMPGAAPRAKPLRSGGNPGPRCWAGQGRRTRRSGVVEVPPRLPHLVADTGVSRGGRYGAGFPATRMLP